MISLNNSPENVIPAAWVPENAAEKFLALYESLSLSLEGIIEARKKGEKIQLVFNPSKSMGSLKTSYERQLFAIRTLLKHTYFKEFWQACSQQNADDFYQIWQDIMNDWATKPSISKAEKNRKIRQTKGQIEKIIKTLNSDHSLQREITLAFMEALLHQWPNSCKNYDPEMPGINMIQLDHFLKKFSEELNQLPEQGWLSSHNKYPTQINEATVETQYLIRRLSPILYKILGQGSHSEISGFIKTLFPHVVINNEIVRKANTD